MAGALVVLGCGNTTGRILETIDAGSPPSATLRVDSFLLRTVSSCAVGTACASTDPTQCFSIGDSSGPRVSFAISGLRFVPPSDPSAVTSGNNQVSCFRVTLDDATFAAASNLFNGLRAQVFQSSGGDIDLDVRFHDVAAIDAGFALFTTGIFLQPPALNTVGLPLVNRETDFTFAITGVGDAATGLAPEMDQCEGTNWPSKGVLGASTYYLAGDVVAVRVAGDVPARVVEPGVAQPARHHAGVGPSTAPIRPADQNESRSHALVSRRRRLRRRSRRQQLRPGGLPRHPGVLPAHPGEALAARPRPTATIATTAAWTSTRPASIAAAFCDLIGR